MRAWGRLICLGVTLFVLVVAAGFSVPAPAAAQGGQPPPGDPTQGAPVAPEGGEQQEDRDEADTSTLLVLGIMAGLVVLCGGLMVLGERTRAPRRASDRG